VSSWLKQLLHPRASPPQAGIVFVCLNTCVDINTPVSVRTVTLSKDAYDALAALKGEGESFSEVVRRLAGSRTLLSAFAGAWRGASNDDVESVRKFLRTSDRLSREKILKLARGNARRGQS